MGVRWVCIAMPVGGMSPVSGWCGWLFLVLRAIEGFGGDSWYRTVVVDAHAVVEGLFS